MTDATAQTQVTQPEVNRAQELIEKLWNDSDLSVRTAVRKKAKDLFPQIKVPEDDIEPLMAPLKAQNEALEARLKKFEEERAEEKKTAEENRTKQTLEDALNSAKSKYNLTAEGFDKMVERMKATGNYSDAEAAAAWVAGLNPPAPPAGPTWAPQSVLPELNKQWGTQQDSDMWKLLHKDPQAYQDAQLSEFVKDPDKFVRETFGG